MAGSKGILRKSCDFCYMRKIKCDGQKPRCSNCVTYVMDCTYAAPSRKSKSTIQKSSVKIEKDTRNLHSRVGRLEILLEQLTNRSGDAEKPYKAEHNAKDVTFSLPMIMTNEDGDRTYGRRSSKALDLPPRQQVLPLVHIFLEKFNALLPLFHPATLLHLVDDVYSLPPQDRDPVSWAAVNVVLGLAHLVDNGDPKSSVKYLSKAQSTLSDIILGDIQLLNIQVLVGVVMLLRGSCDLQPSLILVATTLRLAHQIGLHNRASTAHLDPILARQHKCVFWLAYILDKDLSVRTKQPSIQLDDDIDLDFPGPQGGDYTVDIRADIDQADIGTGVITTTDGIAGMNYFETRIQLAAIEGGVYDYLYSTRAQKRGPEERLHALNSVAHALDQWKASIPPEFRGAEALKRAPPDTIQFLCVLNATSLLCTTSINQAHAWNAQWVTSLRRYSSEGTSPALPPRWEALVDESRDLMLLFGQLKVVDPWIFWVTGCSYMTAMMLLVANNLHKPLHNKSSVDMHLVDAGLQIVDGMVEETEHESLRSFRDICIELHQHSQRRRSQAMMKAGRHEFLSYFSEDGGIF